MTTDDLLARLEREARKAGLVGDTSDVVVAAAAKVRALTARLDTTHTVIRRFVHGWMPDAEPVGEETFDRWYLESGIDDTDIGGTEPMSPAEAVEIRAVTTDSTPQTDTDR
jgi:hypothetical protein